MKKHRFSRRRFIGSAMATVATFEVLDLGQSRARAAARLHLTGNVYPWLTFYQHEGKDFNADLDAGLGQVAAAGLDGFEPIINTPADIDRLVPLLKNHGLEMRSFYVNSTLHEPDAAEESIARIAALAQKAKAAGTRIIVTNPNPIRWGGPEAKNDTQLRTQAKAMERLGGALKDRGLTLAYHFHGAELEHAARELHHMMVGTDPRRVTLCLDAHWVYRGAGDSEVAVFDITRLYGRRISELHLRQSQGGIWQEAFDAQGDIDYAKLVTILAGMNVKPHLVLEQAIEDKTPKTMTPLEAHRRGAVAARRVLAPLTP